MVREKKSKIYGLKGSALNGRSWMLPAAILFIMPIGASSALITNAGTAILNAGNGSVVVTGGGQTSGCIDWFNNTVPSCPQPNGTTATFSVQSGSSSAPFNTPGETGSIQDLNFNTLFPVVDFITIVTPAGLAHFDLADLRTNLGPAIGSCTQATGDLGSSAVCTPAGSAFQLLNGIAGPNGVDTVSIALTVDLFGYIGNSGTNYNAANPYVGLFTTQTPVAGNIDTILQELASGQGVSASWSATLIPSNPVPEPGTLWTLGGALLGCGVALRRRRASASK